MDANEIAVTILSVPGAANYAEDKEAVKISRRINQADRTPAVPTRRPE